MLNLKIKADSNKSKKSVYFFEKKVPNCNYLKNLKAYLYMYTSRTNVFISVARFV